MGLPGSGMMRAEKWLSSQPRAVSPATVKKLVSEIFEALGARNRAEAVAAGLGMLEVEAAGARRDGERSGA
ncbi:MAG: hypothetical protein QN147_11605 [Armatimonadota bacterium]|nr:hypothetical protein [Armatimonadota bacterium]MDR7456457.1 hypothetical protein [Armatimonadota bacterium]MDR7512646.1 hypothetical protein [Armatimonadota bacterium]